MKPLTTALGEHPGLRAIARRLGVPLCLKHRHPSRGAAQAQIRSVLRRDRDTQPGRVFHEYPCPVCSRWLRREIWHVGHAQPGDDR